MVRDVEAGADLDRRGMRARKLVNCGNEISHSAFDVVVPGPRLMGHARPCKAMYAVVIEYLSGKTHMWPCRSIYMHPEVLRRACHVTLVHMVKPRVH